MIALKLWLMRRYCPGFEASLPAADDDTAYIAEAVIVRGRFGQNSCVYARRRVVGLRNAYMAARWLGLLADWRYPAWLYAVGIHYRVRPA
jgi:hypothetical protein